ncbi:MAG: hypothetical protein ABR575_05040 [Actinomycetota bacterium]
MTSTEGPEDRVVDPKLLHDTLLELMSEVRSRYGDREPSEDEMRSFLRERLGTMGKSPEEADEILRDLG